ncbi:hypothetical protein FSARC_8539 [Fusarium sarcochroum]|uniref:Oxidoreductase acuF-like C2H2 type zinc-finger domain-containing protein n=1 Tax=Fusarium sarcochroum TaxID=1208366 RepID=A0A8H4TSW0_9HYPO|nr:hypothetical protein FSARC_8539 [Fusarium sarcochroum]
MDSIEERVSACLRGFNSLCNAPDIWASAASDENLHADDADDVSLLGLKNELSRFKVWSGNIGAHRKGRSSLDHRLRDASNIRDQVIQLLQDLQESLDDAKDILMGEITPWDQDSPPSDIADGDDSDDDNSFQIDPPASSELSQIFDGIVQNINCLFRLSVSIHNPSHSDRLKKASLIDTSHFEPFDVKHVRARFTTAPNTVTERLGRAISRRRQYFKYRELHHQKLASGLNDKDKTNRAQSTVASSLPDNLNLDEPISLELEDDQESDAGRSQTSYATSAPNQERRKIPALPQGAEDGPFECPFCFMMIRISSRRLWNSSEEIKTHLSMVHAATSDSAHLSSLLSICQQPKPEDDTAECPLCKEILPNLKQYQRHVGRHQEDLALFALPQLPGDDSGQNGEDTEDDARVEEQEEEEEEGEESDRDGVDAEPMLPESSDQDLVAEEDKVQERIRELETAARTSSSHPGSLTEEFAYDNPITRKEQEDALTHQCNQCYKTFTSADNLREEDPQMVREGLVGMIGSLNPGLELPREGDVIRLRGKGVTYPVHFPEHSIRDGRIVVSNVQVSAALRMEIPEGDSRKIRLTCNGRHLKDTNAPVRDYGVDHNSLVLAVSPHELEIDDDSFDKPAIHGYERGTDMRDDAKKTREKDLNHGSANPDQTDIMVGSDQLKEMGGYPRHSKCPPNILQILFATSNGFYTNRYIVTALENPLE